MLLINVIIILSLSPHIFLCLIAESLPDEHGPQRLANALIRGLHALAPRLLPPGDAFLGDEGMFKISILLWNLLKYIKINTR